MKAQMSQIANGHFTIAFNIVAMVSQRHRTFHSIGHLEATFRTDWCPRPKTGFLEVSPSAGDDPASGRY
jgi:hypothetical protein